MRNKRKNTKIKKTVKKVKPSFAKKASARQSKSGIIPLADRVLVKPLENNENVTASGIIIPDTVSKEKPEQGEVMAVGEGKWNKEGKRIPVSVQVGDKVVFSKYGYDEIKVGDKEYYVIKEENILAIIKN